ncbi:GNAT family N-acetyltransferase [Azospirillum sp.]|uniref:GNAT family N-acetyltransferase n=1 Tax=Azospirillum sp. TaxID=34012 RepID=UPI003D705726
MSHQNPSIADGSEAALQVRPAEPSDVPAVIALDAETTGLEKPDYWSDLFERYGRRRTRDRVFLIAEHGGQPVGFIVGEVRAWEFGSPPSGWIFAVNVKPGARQLGVGSQLFESICACFRQAGVQTVRTMLSKDATLLMSFFRSQGMRAGPFIELEKSL